MDTLPLQLSWLTYLLASCGYAFGVLRPDPARRDFGPRLILFAFVLHTGFLLWRHAVHGTLPATNAGEGLALFAWMLVGLYLAVQSRFDLGILGAIVAPLAFVLTFGAFLLGGNSGEVPDALHSPELAVHITLAFLGDAVFALAFALSAIYLIQERLLKERTRGHLIQRLPPLERLDRLNHVSLLWGVGFLTLGILTGGLWSANVSGRFWSGEAREFFSVLTWLLYVGLIQQRFMSGLRGRRAARFTVIAFGVLLVCYFAVNLLPLPGRHGGGLGA